MNEEEMESPFDPDTFPFLQIFVGMLELFDTFEEEDQNGS